MNTDDKVRVSNYLCQSVPHPWLICFCIFAMATAALGQAEIYGARLEQSVNRGLAFLAKQQNSDGSFGTADQANQQLAGLTLLAFLSAGQVPDLGRYGAVTRGATDSLVTNNFPSASKNAGAITVLALAQVFGVDGDQQDRQRLREAILQVLPKLSRGAADAAQPLWRQLAVRACIAIGVLSASTPSTAPSVAATTQPIAIKPFLLNAYARFCLARAGWSLGGWGRENLWRPMASKVLAGQQSDGGWPSESGGSRVYASDMAILTLTIPYQLMPGMGN